MRVSNYIKHHGIKGQKWGVRRFQNKDGSLTAKGKKRYNDDEYDEEREALEKENARRAGVKYVRKTKKEREAEDTENEKIFNARLEKDTAAQKRTEDRMKEIDKKLQAKYDLSSMDDLDKYYKEYDEAWFEVLAEERKKEGLAHADLFTLDELYHHGIKGQKWGRRRYQNADGSLTPAGKQRYGSKENFEKQYPEDRKAATKAVKKVSDKGAEVARSAREIEAERTKKRQSKADKALEKAAREKARKMSDQELREAVNRLNLEENYTRMMQNRERISVGESTVAKVLNVTLTAMTVTSTALGIATAIQELKRK